jgi:hypothetical protein
LLPGGRIAGKLRVNRGYLRLHKRRPVATIRVEGFYEWFVDVFAGTIRYAANVIE